MNEKEYNLPYYPEDPLLKVQYTYLPKMKALNNLNWWNWLYCCYKFIEMRKLSVSKFLNIFSVKKLRNKFLSECASADTLLLHTCNNAITKHLSLLILSLHNALRSTPQRQVQS